MIPYSFSSVIIQNSTLSVSGGVLSVDGVALATAAQLSPLAPLNNPALTGIPTAPTASPGTNTTQLATTAFTTLAVATAVASTYHPKGGIDCSANPNYPAGTANDTYNVTVGGKIGGASGPQVEVGDTLVCLTTTAAGTHASVGVNWNIVQSNIQGITAFALTLLDDTSAIIARTTLGLQIGTNVQAYRAELKYIATVGTVLEAYDIEANGTGHINLSAATSNGIVPMVADSSTLVTHSLPITTIYPPNPGSVRKFTTSTSSVFDSTSTSDFIVPLANGTWGAGSVSVPAGVPIHYWSNDDGYYLMPQLQTMPETQAKLDLKAAKGANTDLTSLKGLVGAAYDSVPVIALAGDTDSGIGISADGNAVSIIADGVMRHVVIGQKGGGQGFAVSRYQYHYYEYGITLNSATNYPFILQVGNRDHVTMDNTTMRLMKVTGGSGTSYLELENKNSNGNGNDYSINLVGSDPQFVIRLNGNSHIVTSSNVINMTSEYSGITVGTSSYHEDRPRFFTSGQYDTGRTDGGAAGRFSDYAGGVQLIHGRADGLRLPAMNVGSAGTPTVKGGSGAKVNTGLYWDSDGMNISVNGAKTVAFEDGYTNGSFGGLWDNTGTQIPPQGGGKRRIHPISLLRFDNALPMDDGVLAMFYLNKPMSAVEWVKINHTANTHATETVKMAFYTADPVTRYPLNKIANTEVTVSLTSTGIKQINYSPQPSLPAGLIWCAMVCTSPSVVPYFVCTQIHLPMTQQSLFGAPADPNQYWGTPNLNIYGFTSLPSSFSPSDIQPGGTHADVLRFSTPFIIIKEA